MHSLGRNNIDRRALLRRGAALAGVSVLAFPALAQAGVDEDLAEVRLVCATKRLTITWYTQWDDSKLAAPKDAAWLPKFRAQEEQSYDALAPLALGIELGAASRIGDPLVAGPVAAIAATNAMHIALYTGALTSSLPVALSAADASTQLGEYLQ
jgi:hypothetical protein